MLIKTCDARQMEAYVAENVVARVCIGRHCDAPAQLRDHSHIARAYAALGKAGSDELTQLVIKEAHRVGFVDERVLSADTTAQELPIGSPHEPGILRGLAQRCGRALTQLKPRGMAGRDHALAQGQTIWRSVQEHHLGTSAKAAKREVLTRLLKEVGAGIVHTRPLGERLERCTERVLQSARARLLAMHEVSKPLMGQSVQWLAPGKVAAHNIVHGGDSPSPRHGAPPGGQEDGVWLGLSEQPLGPRASLSCNLNKFMRDCVKLTREGIGSSDGTELT
jgi:hypothetical protein